MRKILLLLSLLSAFQATLAHERSLDEMRQIACAFWSGTHRASSLDNDVNVVLQKEMLTVFQAKGMFVVIANDDAFRAVIGYSDASFSSESKSLEWFLDVANESMARDVKMGVTHRAPVVPDASRFKASFDPLLSTKWNQGEPYNLLCPKATNGNNYPSGCVATALSQIMKYHSFPVKGIGEKQYSFKPAEGVGEILYANFGETTYEWDKMLDDYKKGEYSEEEGNAVATIMLHCGVAVEMNYTPSGSGAYSSEAQSGLIKYFGYNENIGIVYRQYYSLEQWMDMVFSELNEKRPIYYAGSDQSRGGHAFVIDGYNAEGLVHVNWGWGPNGGNGFYDITLLNPSGYQFSIGQNMLLGIDLPTTEVEYESHLVSDNELSVTKIGKVLSVNVGKTIWNLNGDAWDGELAVILEGEGHTYLLSQGTVGKTPNRYDVLSNLTGSISGMLTLPTDITDGVYRLYVGAKNSRDKRWQLVRRSEGLVNSYQVTITDGTINSLVSDASDTWKDTPTAIQVITAKESNGNTVRYYDLQGREVSPSTKGLLIRKQGNEVKKVIVR